MLNHVILYKRHVVQNSILFGLQDVNLPLINLRQRLELYKVFQIKRGKSVME